MPQLQPTLRLPFTEFPGIPVEASRRIWRDFDELVRNITPVTTGFDAVIDPALTGTGSLASQHRYKNLTDCLASETALSLNVGVVKRAASTSTVPIQEPAPPSLGNRDLCLVGIGAQGQSTVGPDWYWQTLTVGNGSVRYINLDLAPNAVDQQVQSGGSAWASGCHFGSHINGFNAAGIAGQSGTCYECVFEAAIAVNGSGAVGISNSFYDCQLKAGVTCGTKGSTTIIGGLCNGWSNGGASNPGNVVVADFNGTALTVAAGGGVFHNTGPSNTGGQVTVSDTAASVIVTGWWDGVIFSGTPAAGLIRRFDGHCGHSVDFTGPGQVICTLGNASGLGRLQLKGNDVNAQVAVLDPLSSGVSAVLNAVGLTNSLVKLSVADLAAGPYKAYAFDAASNHNILIITGSKATNFSTASTDAGSHNRVITEDDDTLLTAGAAPSPSLLNGEIAAVQSGIVTIPAAGAPPSGAAGGSLAGTYPNPTFAGRDSSVDQINRDLLPAGLLPANGIQYAGNSPPGGPAGGSLAGQYPNPTFAGRDASVDDLNKDMTQSFLLMGG